MALGATLEKLPMELRQLILAFVSDLASLKSAASSCRSLYEAFIDAEHIITTQVLRGQVKRDILPHALMTDMACRHEAPWTPEEALGFLMTHFPVTEVVPSRWSLKLKEALPIAGLHADIQYFVDDFLTTTSNCSMSPNRPDFTYHGFSDMERKRVEKAFYHFETYCRVFRLKSRRRGSLDPNNYFRDPKEAFHNMLAPWENEQLACVHYYLLRTLEHVLRAYLTRTPRWCKFLFVAEEGIPASCIEAHLSQGLSFLRHIFENPDFVLELERSDRLYLSQGNFLGETLDKITFEQYFERGFQELSLEEIKTRFAQPQDQDAGPVEAWEWARQSDGCKYLAWDNRPIAHRAWGYVMWDHARLDAWGVLQTDWEESDAIALMAAEEEQRTKDKKLIEEIEEEECRKRDLMDRAQSYRSKSYKPIWP